MASSSLSFNSKANLFLPSPQSSPIFYPRPPTKLFQLGLVKYQDLSLVTSRTKGQPFQIQANPNVPPAERNLKDEVVMVDPLEAKRLAAKQFQQIQAKEKFKRKRRIEAINGAWAMIGLTAGLVVEGHTGKSFLAQLADYWSVIINFFVR